LPSYESIFAFREFHEEKGTPGMTDEYGNLFDPIFWRRACDNCTKSYSGKERDSIPY
jgi:hypothetical protein